MIKPKLVNAILCDAVGQGPDGKKTLYGVFDRIASAAFPLRLPHCEVYSKWSYGEGNHRLHTRIVDSEEKVVFEPEDECTFSLPDPLVSAEIILKMNNITFKSPGTYWIEIYLDGEKEDSDLPVYVDKI